MSDPWRGAARPMSANAFFEAARAIGCDEEAIRAVWQVEASGRGYQSDGTLLRRFEPHKMPGATTNWRDSLKIGPAQREQMFQQAYRQHPEAACRATSWGGPQIMGFNSHAAGFASALEMVRAMADSEDAQFDAFVTLIKAWGLDDALVAHDWLTFARRYNGAGQAAAYARKIEAAYRTLSGQPSPVVLRQGSYGAAVRELQNALGVPADGDFGPDTEAAVRAFQKRMDLAVDGIVGQRTWAALARERDAVPKVQPTLADSIAEKATSWGAAVTAGTGALAAVREAVPGQAYNVLIYGVVAFALVTAFAALFKRLRGAA